MAAKRTKNNPSKQETDHREHQGVREKRTTEPPSRRAGKKSHAQWPRVRFRLKDVLTENGIPVFGAQTALEPVLRIRRAAIGKLLNNQTNFVSLEHLEGICSWLLGHKQLTSSARNRLRRSLPGSLFERTGLWERLFGAKSIVTVLGEKVLLPEIPPGRVRRPTTEWLSGRDAEIAHRIVQKLSAEGSAAKFVPKHAPFHVAERREESKHKRYLEKLVQDRQEALDLFDELHAPNETPRAILVIGSQRVNLLAEILVARCFGVRPFEECKGPEIPFYMSYRKDDQHLPSCFGGHKGPPSFEGTKMPGIYLRDARGWKLLPWKPRAANSGIVLTRVEPKSGLLDILLMGFSGRATRAVGNRFIDHPDEFWPTLTTDESQVGVFACEMNFDENENNPTAAVDYKVHDLTANSLTKARFQVR